MAVVWPVIIIGGLGLVLGVLLGFASKIFAVKRDERIDKIREFLPGANCGGCGFAGCDGLAKAIIEDGAPINSCKVLNSEQLKKIAEIVGVEAEEKVPLVAVPRCLGTFDVAIQRYRYEGISDCAAVTQLGEGTKSCPFACVGLGNCVRVCPTDAITIVNGIARIDEEKCISCGKCVTTCPRNIIALLPRESKARVLCSSHLKGKVVRDSCKVGCIACGMCVKACKFDAIKMVDDLPVIDYEKCTACLECAKVCPVKCIYPFKGKDEAAEA